MLLLEIGTGPGGIAHGFATLSTLRCEVTAVDVMDNRVVRDRYTCRQVEGVELPFDNASFDVVITNHVIDLSYRVRGARQPCETGVEQTP